MPNNARCIICILEEPLTSYNYNRFNFNTCDSIIYIDITKSIKRNYSNDIINNITYDSYTPKNIIEYREILRGISTSFQNIDIIHMNPYQKELLNYYKLSRSFANSLTFTWPYPPITPNIPGYGKYKMNLLSFKNFILKQIFNIKPLFDYYLCPSEFASKYYKSFYKEFIPDCTYDFTWANKINELDKFYNKIIYIDDMQDGHPDQYRLPLGHPDKITDDESSKYINNGTALFFTFLDGLGKYKDKIIFCPHPRSPISRNKLIEKRGFLIKNINSFEAFDSTFIFHGSAAVHSLVYYSVQNNNKFIEISTIHKDEFINKTESISNYYNFKKFHHNDFVKNIFEIISNINPVDTECYNKSLKYLTFNNKKAISLYLPYIKKINT